MEIIRQKTTSFYKHAAPVRLIKVTLTADEIKTAHGTVIEVLPGREGVIYEGMSVVAGLEKFEGTAYDTNTNLQLKTIGADIAQFENDQVLLSTTERLIKFQPIASTSPTETQFIAGAGLQLFVEIGDPLNGLSNVVFYITYQDYDINLKGQ